MAILPAQESVKELAGRVLGVRQIGHDIKKKKKAKPKRIKKMRFQSMTFLGAPG